MPHALRAALSLCLALAPVSASAISIAFTGVIDSVSDGSDFLDASVAETVAVSGTYQVDPSTASSGSPFSVGGASLSFSLGNYAFDASETPHSIALINDTGPPGATVDLWQTGAIALTDLAPASNASGDFGGFAAAISFFDVDSAFFDGSETAPFVPTDLVGWEITRILLDSLDGSGLADGRVQVQVGITSWTVVPEPRSALLIGLGLATLALAGRRRLRAH
jgi:hypothetical protein